LANLKVAPHYAAMALNHFSPGSTLPARRGPNADDTPGQALQSIPLIHVNDPNGLFTSDELTRVHDAVYTVVEPCVSWVSRPRS
jgi:hypothetical protein